MRSHVKFAIRGSDGQTTQHYNRTINMRAKDAMGFASGQINVENSGSMKATGSDCF